MPAPQLARDFYTNEEMKEKASFKKVKKKKNKEGVRKSKMLKADDLLAMSSEAGTQEPVRRRRERPAEDQSLPDGRLPQPMDIDDSEGLAGGNVRLKAKYDMFCDQVTYQMLRPWSLTLNPSFPGLFPSKYLLSNLSIDSLSRGAKSKE